MSKEPAALDATGRPERTEVRLSDIYTPEYLHEQFIAHRARIVHLYPNLLTEMALIYRVALFDAYVPDMIKAVLLHHPGILKDGKRTLTWEEVLNLHTKGIVVESLVDREVDRISRESAQKQIKWVSEKLNVSLVANADQEDTLVEITARRNILVHNSGIINEQYLSAVPNSTLAIGERVIVDADYWRNSSMYLRHIALGFMFALARQYCPGSYLDVVDGAIR